LTIAASDLCYNIDLMNQVLCKHFGLCGGCSFQDVPYAEQLAGKEKRIADLMQKGGFDAELKPIHASEPHYYRNKMEFSFGGNLEKLTLGMNSKNKQGIFDLEECLIFCPDAGTIVSAVRDFCREKKWVSFNKYNHKGFLRYLIVREAKFTHELMVGVVATSQNVFDKEGFVKLLRELKLQARIKSIFYIQSDSWSDAVVFENKEILFGEEFIVEELNGLKLNVGIDSFFQVNPATIQKLYQRMVDVAQVTADARVLDLFCGVGSIGLFLAAKAKFVWGVEVSAPIAAAARANALMNNVKNIEFVVADARDFLQAQNAFYRGVDLLVINPPRCGVAAKAIRAILRLEPKQIIYSSCNPETMFGDLEILKEAYAPQFFEPFDFFPHTKHMECLTILVKKTS